ncbi:sporulation protein [Streptomyces bambusae]|uniref:Uncharacterized protein n=1 Tax=Streptomyces bambusae TaxID=1550616 RepID=A0ABS6Z7A5_9ACTN|nr:sporulation protein [Streptomyces bambusae]MBW5483451.1 hypothetical protein [Streptomyces bambusae]
MFKRLLRRIDGTSVEVDTQVLDLLRVSALPLHEAILNAFAEEGFVCGSAELVDQRLPEVDQLFDFHQSFLLTALAPTRGLGDLEVTVLTNAVGCEIFVRSAAPERRYWDDRGPARRFIAAHHDVERIDWLAEVRRWIDEVALLAR